MTEGRLSFGINTRSVVNDVDRDYRLVSMTRGAPSSFGMRLSFVFNAS